MTAPIYPKALASWTDRINNQDTVWAADPNSLAAEVLAIEQTLGSMPQVETAVPVGNPVSYSNVSARISAAMLQQSHPYVELYRANFKVGYGNYNYGVPNVYQAVEDDFGYFNGSDITVKASGVYLIDVFQQWEYATSGYVNLFLVINNIVSRSATWPWNSIPVNGPAPGGGSYNGRPGFTNFTWMGKLAGGNRIRVVSENGTTHNPATVINSSLRMYYLRSLTDAQADQGPSTYPV